MKKITLFLIFAIIYFSVFSQTGYGERTYGNISADSQIYRLISDNVNLRKAPYSKAELVQKLKIGTQLKVISQSDSISTINGFEQNWFEIQVLDKSGKATAVKGFLWGGFIAENIFDSKEDKGVTFLYGISKVTLNEYYEIPYIQVRAILDTVELSKLEFEAVGSLTTSHNLELYDSKGLRNVKNILNLNFSDGFCGGAAGDIVIFWDGAALHYVKTLSGGADAPVFFSEEFIYPTDENGETGKVIFYEEAGEYMDDGNINYNYQRSTKYKWTGCELEKVD